MTARHTRLPTYRSAATARRRAAATIPDSVRAVNEGTKTRHLVDADAFAALGRSPATARLAAARSALDRYEAVVGVRRRAARRAERHWVDGVVEAGNPLPPLVWLVAVSVVVSIDVVLGRFVVARVAPDDGDRLVWLATAGVATWIFLTSHLIGSGLAAALGRASIGHWRRWLAVAVGCSASAVAFVVVVMIATEAGPGRWAISFVPLVAGSLVQAHRPHPAVWHWLAWSLVHLALTPIELRLSGSVDRATARLSRAVVETRARWLASGSARRGVDGEWGLATGDCSVEVTESELERLSATGLVPEPQAVHDLLDRLSSIRRPGPTRADDGPEARGRPARSRLDRRELNGHANHAERGR